MKYVLPCEREQRSFEYGAEYPGQRPPDSTTLAALPKSMIYASAIRTTLFRRVMDARPRGEKRCSASKLGSSTSDKHVFGYATI